MGFVVVSWLALCCLCVMLFISGFGFGGYSSDWLLADCLVDAAACLD